MPRPSHRTLCWVRRDLRLSDSRALALACEAEEAAVFFLFDRAILDPLPDRRDRRLTFIRACLEEMDRGLEEKGSCLLSSVGFPEEEVVKAAKAWGADRVVASHDDDPYALARDKAVGERLRAEGISFETVKDHVVLERKEVARDGTPFRVYTPYMKAWRALVKESDYAEAAPDLSRAAPASSLPPQLRGVRNWDEIGFQPSPPLWLEAGESGAQKRLASFLGRMDRYAEARDMVDSEGVSGLSVHLRFGTLSIRQCVRASIDVEGEGARKWLNELIWREFYHMILACFPHVVEKPFQEKLDSIAWPGLPEHFEAWKEGRTGYPIVDAGMRILKETGWMHNRMRMITASFLTKDLLVDWRLGEAWFAEQLLDFDLASNNGGWQWSASTGVDAQPYFRIFNPLLQSRKFDPEGAFIKQGCPELRGFTKEVIHAPSEAGPLEQASAGCFIGEDYPLPIVDHQVQKGRALALFQGAEKV